MSVQDKESFKMKVIIKFKKDYKLLGVVAKKKGDTLEVERTKIFPFKWKLL